MKENLEIKKIMRYLSIFFYLIFIIFLSFSNANTLENKIVIKINNKIITSVDLLNEIKILKLLNKNLNNLNKIELLEISKKSLKNQTFKEIELLKHTNKLELPENNLNSFLIKYIEKIGFNSIQEFLEYCKSNSIQFDLIKKKIIIELLWSQLIYQKYFKSVNIDEKVIKENILKNKSINEYLVSEIVFNIKNKKELNSKFDEIKNKINVDGFEKTALTYSISDTSKDGGRIGWVKETSLSKTILEIVKKTKINTFTNPIQITGGFIILHIQDIREIENNFNINEEVEKVIKIRTNKQLNQFSNIYLNKITNDFQINEF